MPGAIMGPLLDDRTAPLFDPTKVRYVGTANSGVRVCVTLKGNKIGSFADAQKVKAKLGGSGPNDSTFEYGLLHRHTGGALWDVVSGYRGTAEMALAMERGEIDGVCGWDWSSFKSQKPDWLRDNKANVLLQASIEPHPVLAKMGVPTAFDFVKDEDSRKVLELVVSQTVFHRSYIAPPETPPEQLAVLRKAFDDTMADKAFLADAEKVSIDIDPLPGAKVQDVVAKLYAAPPAIVERARKAIRPELDGRAVHKKVSTGSFSRLRWIKTRLGMPHQRLSDLIQLSNSPADVIHRPRKSSGAGRRLHFLLPPKREGSAG